MLSKEKEIQVAGMSVMTSGVMKEVATESGVPTITVIDVGRTSARLADLLEDEHINISATSGIAINPFESGKNLIDGE